MNCQKFLELIDSISFIEDASLRLAVEKHVRSCDACRNALEDARRLEAELRLLPEVEPPADLLTTLRHRIDRLEKRAASPPEAAPVRTRTTSSFRPWGMVLTGFALSLSALVYMLFVGEASLRLLTSPLSSVGLTIMPHPSWALLALVIGLLLYLHGLFSAPSRSGSV